MSTELIYELIGYTASILIAVSMMMSRIVTLRVLNMIGAATFALYGYLIGSVPVAALNGFIVLVNLYYLAQMYRTSSFFKILQVDPDNDYLIYFLKFYEKDMRKTQSGFKLSPENESLCLFVLRDMIPAGLLIGHRTADGVLTIDVDYVIPQYRDYQVGKYLFESQKQFFTSNEIREVRAYADVPIHRNYLMQMGFKSEDTSGWYSRKF